MLECAGQCGDTCPFFFSLSAVYVCEGVHVVTRGDVRLMEVRQKTMARQWRFHSKSKSVEKNEALRRHERSPPQQQVYHEHSFCAVPAAVSRNAKLLFGLSAAAPSLLPSVSSVVIDFQMCVCVQMCESTFEFYFLMKEAGQVRKERQKIKQICDAFSPKNEARSVENACPPCLRYASAGSSWLGWLSLAFHCWKMLCPFPLVLHLHREATFIRIHRCAKGPCCSKKKKCCVRL